MADTKYTRDAFDTQMDAIFADNTNGDIDAADIRQSLRDLAESTVFLTSENILSEDNVFGEIDHVSVFGATGVPSYSNTNEVKPRIDVYSDDKHAIRLQNTDNVDADEEAWSFGQKDSGEFVFYRVSDAAGTYTYNEIFEIDENDMVRFSGVGFTEGSTYEIASGSITPKGSKFIVDVEGGAASTDDLDTIATTNYKSGDIISVSTADTARDVVIKDGTGNIQVEGGSDITLGAVGHITFMILHSGSWRTFASFTG